MHIFASNMKRDFKRNLSSRLLELTMKKLATTNGLQVI